MSIVFFGEFIKRECNEFGEVIFLQPFLNDMTNDGDGKCCHQASHSTKLFLICFFSWI